MSSPHASAARLESDLERINREKPEGYEVLSCTNVFGWTVLLEGPEDSAYRGMKMIIFLRFPKNYPSGPPVVSVACNVFHPNIHPKTKVFWVEELALRWKPNYDGHLVVNFVMDALRRPSMLRIQNVRAAMWFSNVNEVAVHVVESERRILLWSREAERRQQRTGCALPDVE